MRHCRTALILLTVSWLAACAGAQSRMEPLAVTLSDVAPGQMGLLEQEFALKIGNVDLGELTGGSEE